MKIEKCKNPEKRKISLLSIKGKYVAIGKLREIGILFCKAPKNKVLVEALIKSKIIDVSDLSKDSITKILVGFASAATEPKKASQESPKPISYKPNATLKAGESFYDSWAWKDLRLQALKKYGRRCMCCGAFPSKTSDVVLHVDHIKSVRLHPELALDIDNLQVLCADCNRGKGYWDETDFRDR